MGVDNISTKRIEEPKATATSLTRGVGLEIYHRKGRTYTYHRQICVPILCRRRYERPDFTHPAPGNERGGWSCRKKIHEQPFPYPSVYSAGTGMMGGRITALITPGHERGGGKAGQSPKKDATPNQNQKPTENVKIRRP